MGDSSVRYRRLRPVVEELMQIGGTPGLAVAVMTRGKLVYQDNFGVRDIEASLPVTDRTIFPAASLTKAVTAAAFSMLVDEGKAGWDTPLKDLLPEFNSRDETLRNSATVTDMLCHRHGMAWRDSYTFSTGNNCLVPREATMRFLNDQERLLPFRSRFAYNNNGYELVGKVIEHLSGLSYIDFVKTRIFGPLGMDSTFLVTPPSTAENVAKSYNTLDDSTPALITAPKMGDDLWGAASGGIRSNTVDLLKLYQYFLDSFLGKSRTSKEEAPPLPQGPLLMSARIPLATVSRNEASYALGWARVQLPGTMGHIGANPSFMREGMPVIGKGVPPQLVVFHQGSLAGAIAFVGLLPDTESIVLVLSNALALNDVPDWVGQLLIEELLDVPQSERVDFAKAARTAVATNLEWHPRVSKQLAEQRTNGTWPRNLEAYVGTYWDRSRVFKMVVTLENGTLYRSLQGLDNEKFEMSHYENDTFVWLTSRNELTRRGRWVGDGPAFWKLEFQAGDDGIIRRLFWAPDDGVPTAQFDRQD